MIGWQKIEDIAGEKRVLMKRNRARFEGNGHGAFCLFFGYYFAIGYCF
jgi:hypothetical protein